MNYKVITVYTLISMVLAVSAGIPFGIWAGHDNTIIESPIYHLLSYFVGFLVSVCVYYFLFKVRLNKPILHAVAIGVLSNIFLALTFFYIIGRLPATRLLYVDSLLMSVAIALAYLVCKASGKFGDRA